MTHAHKIFIRSKKEDSVFIYHILEAQEGLASYSTIAFKAHDPFRDLELLVSEEMVPQVHAVLASLGDMVIILPEDPSKK
jgi:hypothetical protein